MRKILRISYLIGCFALAMVTTFSMVNAQGLIQLQRTEDSSEAATTPNTPIGTTNGNVGQSYIYTIKGSSTNLGDPIQYFIDWGDGTNSGWVPSSSNITSPDTNYLVNKSWTSPGIYSVKAKARCAIHTTIESAWSGTLLVTISVAIDETISTPSIQGPTNGDVITNYTYTVEGASSNLGHTIEYRFDWGDGSYSNWSSLISVSKSWSSAGVYTVKAQARCTVDTSVVSNWSDRLLVSIGSKNGWILISLSTGGVLNSVHFPSINEGWAVGYDKDHKGLSFHYLNGSWEKVNLPDVSSDWDLRGVHFTSPNEGWAVGSDLASLVQGLLIHYSNGKWTIVTPPNVNTTYWYLSSVYFTSPSEGWAVGNDEGHGQGILFHYLNGVWESLNTPFLSIDWNLSDINFISPNEGWAVGFDYHNQQGVLFHYLDGSWSYVSPPNVSPYWSLSGVHFTSSSEGWAVGESNNNGILLHYVNGSWEVVVSPVASSGSQWLNSVHFTSPEEGWAVGVKDYDNRMVERGKGLLLHYLNGNWIEVIPPDVSSLWQLLDVYFASSEEGWAVGYNREGASGCEVVLFKYSASLLDIISNPSTPNGPTTDITGTSYSYSTGGSVSNLGHSLEYQFDWKGDGTDLSSWGAATQSKAWAVAGTYNVRARARCTVDTSAVSDWSLGLAVNIVLPITLQSPLSNTHFSTCSLYSIPTFAWTIGEPFKGYEIQFSLDSDFISPIKVRVSGTQSTITSATWKKIMLLPGSDGGTVYWRVVGTRANRTTFTSEVRSITVEPSEPVGTPTISPMSKTSLPELSWQNDCNTKFKVWFGSDESFNKKNGYSFNIRNPNDNGGIFTKVLNSGQWKPIRNLVGDVSGPTIYWYVESWDGLGRYSKTDVMNFVLTE